MNMKKIIPAAMILLSIMLTACAPAVTVGAKDGATIRPAEFSEETRNVLDLFDDEIMFFDYTADDTIKSSTISVWAFEDGDWVNKGDSSGNIDKSDSQIALRFTDTGYELYNIDESGHVKYASPEIFTAFSDTTQQSIIRLDNPTKITPDTEIPLYVKLGNNGNVLSASYDFRDSNCTAGVAVTVTFSDKFLA